MAKHNLPKWIALAVTCAVMLLRHPALTLDPAFFAEEGSVYFEIAWLESPLSALVTVHGGYYSLIPTLSTLLAAHCVPLEYAPYLTAACALIVAQIPVAQILWSPSSLFAPPLARLGGVVALTLLSVFVLTTLYSMVYLIAVAFLAILEESEVDTPRRRRRWNRLLLVIAGLGSPMACFLLPVVLLLAIRRRHIRPAAAVLTACVGVQAVACVLSFPWNARRGLDELFLLPQAMLNGLVDSVLPSRWLPADLLAPGTSWLPVVGAALLVALLAWSFRRCLAASHALLFTGALLIFAALPLGLGVHDLDAVVQAEPNPRYLFGMRFVLLLGMVVAVTQPYATPRPRWRLGVIAVLAVLAVALVSAFVRGVRASNHPAAPDWQEEVAAWREDPQHTLAIAPAGWVAVLYDVDSDMTFRIEQAPASQLPSLQVHERRVGDRLTVISEVRTKRPLTRGVAMLGHLLDTPASLPGVPGAELRVDLANRAAAHLPFRTDREGYWRIELPARDFARYFGHPVCAQVWITDPEPALSNAVTIHVERRRRP